VGKTLSLSAGRAIFFFLLLLTWKAGQGKTRNSTATILEHSINLQETGSVLGTVFEYCASEDWEYILSMFLYMHTHTKTAVALKQGGQTFLNRGPHWKMLLLPEGCSYYMFSSISITMYELRSCLKQLWGPEHDADAGQSLPNPALNLIISSLSELLQKLQKKMPLQWRR